MSILKYIELPHVGTYKRRWVRRVMIVLTVPQELARALFRSICGTLGAIYFVFYAAAWWWRQPNS